MVEPSLQLPPQVIANLSGKEAEESGVILLHPRCTDHHFLFQFASFLNYVDVCAHACE